ncbi:MAG: hypothetical protein EOO06_14525 [Chitinophagaceae bacterium]|nr:MAG: hypothetical protein EOO06_14525 [Chitinophagaceae bacterium]
MPTQKTFKKRNLPPCPDPENYCLVRHKDNSYYWRLRRGTRKPAVLNEAFAANATLTALISPLISRLTIPIIAFAEHRQLSRLHTRLLTPVKKYYKEHNRISYTGLLGMDLLPHAPLHRLFAGSIDTRYSNEMITVMITAGNNYVKKNNTLVTDYYFEAMLLVGDISHKTTLEIDTEQSELLSFTGPAQQNIQFQFISPLHEPWVLILKLACFEGHQKAANDKHYGIRIIATG